MGITVTKTKTGELLRFKTFMTEQTEEHKPYLVVQIDNVDEKLNIKAKGYAYTVESSEENFHKKLRVDSSRVNSLITSHSTNPEWNPENYTKNLE